MSQLNFHNDQIIPPPPKLGSDFPLLLKLTDAYKIWHTAWQHIPRLSRYTIGDKIDNLFIESIELLINAGYASRAEKLSLIRETSVTFDKLKYFLQLAWELKIFDHKKYAFLSTPLQEVGRMLGGWIKQAEHTEK